MKRMTNYFLNQVFPTMALSGLLLAGWGLIITPQDINGEVKTDKGLTQWKWGASQDGTETTSGQSLSWR